MTRIACVSDLHENLIDIPPADVLVIAGDISYAFKGDIVTKQAYLLNQFRVWATHLPVTDVVIVAGNHDQSIEKWGWPSRLASNPHLHYLQDEGVELHGVKFWGTPWQPWFYDWAFNAPERGGEEFLADKFSAIPDDTDVVICHGPPRNLGDGVGDPAHPESQRHVGSLALLDAIGRVQPRLCVVGHIHSGHGEYRLSPVPTHTWMPESAPKPESPLEWRETIVCNAAVVNEKYEAVHEPFVYDL